MLDWAGEVPANPGVTGNQNSNTPTCGLWCHAVCAELGEERIRGLRRPRPRRLQIGHVQYVLLQPTNVELLLHSIRQQDASSGIIYFTRPDNYDDINILTCDDLRKLINGCAKGIDELVVDLSSICDERTRKLFDFANQILVVLDGTRTSSAKWVQFQTQNNVYEQIRSKIKLIANKGAKLDGSSVNGLVSLPFVQTSDPVTVYKTLSASFS